MQSENDMKVFVTHLLTENLSTNYLYHNLAHTLYVTEQAMLIGKSEGCDAQEMRLLEAAALWHDTGFISTYKNHEEAGCELVQKHLLAFQFSTDEIDAICTMIMATKIPQAPTNKLAEIIADADLAYLGTANAAKTANYLFKEWQSFHPVLTTQQWNQTQILFLEQHHYFTHYCKQNRELAKQAYLTHLREKIK